MTAQRPAPLTRRLDQLSLARFQVPNDRVVLVSAADGRVLYIDGAHSELVRRPATAALGQSIVDVLRLKDVHGTPVPRDTNPITVGFASNQGHDAGRSDGLYVDAGDGALTEVLVTVVPIPLSKRANGLVVICERAEPVVDRDPVTSLPTASALAKSIAGAPGQTKGVSSPVYVVVFAVNRVDRIRQTLSARGVEWLMRDVAHEMEVQLGRILWGLRSSDSPLASLESGEFAIAFSGSSAQSDSFSVAERLVREFEPEVQIDGRLIPVTMSAAVGAIGPAVDPLRELGTTAATARELALVHARRVSVADNQLQERVSAALRKEGELRRGLANDELCVFYQPLIDLRTLSHVGVEALVRWNHPSRGVLGADSIISDATAAELMGQVSWRVLDLACDDSGRWGTGSGVRSTALAVNVAPEQLSAADFARRIRATLDRTGFDPTRLVLEIAEVSAFTDPDMINTELRQLRDLGVRIAIDDFGTGYSSLEQLQVLPVDILKIDNRFVARMATDPGDAAIVAAIVRLGHSLGLEVVAEGVETREQLVQLRALGCDVAQGFLWAKPMPSVDLEKWCTVNSERGVARGARQPELVDVHGRVDEAVAVLVHELQSPVSAIEHHLELVREDDDPQVTLDAIGRSARELQDLLAALTDMYDLSRGYFAVTPTRIDLGELVRSVVAESSSMLAGRPVDLFIDGPIVAEADPLLVKQVLRNLLSNAVKFSPAATHIGVVVSEDPAGEEVRIAVRDHGPGVPEHRRVELFRRFSRLGAKTKGMGLGLYLVKAICEAHGGQVEYRRTDDGVSVFEMRLPTAVLGANLALASSE